MELKTYKIQMRLWHWLNAAAIFGLLGTVLLRKTFLSYKANALIIQSELAKINMDISVDAAKIVAKAIRTPMWNWHYIFGFFLAGLLVYRIILHFSERPLFSLSEIQATPAKFKMIEYMYLVFYVMILLMAISGSIMYFRETLSLAKETVEAIKEKHELLMYFFAIYAPLHIIGVFIAENREPEKKGIVSNMIGGK